MKLTAKVKLQPTEHQHNLLMLTLERANEACNEISDVAWEKQTFRQYDLHKLVYAAIRSNFGLTAQLVVRCISKVADGYKLDKKAKRTFQLHGGIAYDDRILRWYTDKQFVSIWTLAGRERVPFVCSDYQRDLLQGQHGEADLCLIGGEFYLFATCEKETPDPSDIDGFLGVDMGVTNIATTSDGENFTSATIEKNRQRHQRMRNELQSKGTKSARRKLKKLRRKQARFQANTNHVISKRLVSTAVHTKRGIAVEDLTAIRQRTRVKGKENRAKHSNWSFAQLRTFIEYKAKLQGVPVVAVDPSYTSQRCFVCGHIEAANRKSQSEFLCQACGHTANADVNAANNISGLPSTNPMSRPLSYRTMEPGTSPSALALGC
jgi:putative transposase